MDQRQREQLRELAARVNELAYSSENRETLQLWSDHNSLKKVRPPVYLLIMCWNELIPEEDMIFREGLLRDVEFQLRTRLYNASLGFDFVVDPFVTIPAVFEGPGADGIWGVHIKRNEPSDAGGAWRFDPPLREYEDIENLRKPQYRIDHAATDERVAIVSDAIGDSLEVRVDYGGPIPVWIAGSVAWIAAGLRGLHQLMTDVLDNPAWVHRLMQFIMEGHIEYLQEMERQNLVTPNRLDWPFYSAPLCDGSDPGKVRLRDCWGCAESQEFDLFSPAMFDEFLLQYQIPILALTSLNHYGCCENLTHKYTLLKKIPGLRRVAVSPWTDFDRAVEILGGDYVLNWRYSTSEVVFSFSEEKIRKTIRRNLDIAGDTPVEIILQDIQTVLHQPDLLRKWIRIARNP